jgi:hypothetical protein
MGLLEAFTSTVSVIAEHDGQTVELAWNRHTKGIDFQRSVHDPVLWKRFCLFYCLTSILISKYICAQFRDTNRGGGTHRREKRDRLPNKIGVEKE